MPTRAFAPRTSRSRFRNPAAAAARPIGEPLEGRVLLADTLTLVTDLNDASIGPNPPGQHQATSDGRHYFDQFTAVSGKVFFTADRSPVGRELWVTDGTQAGTRLVKDIYAGPGSSTPRGLADVNGTLVFSADDGIHGLRQWRSDGTEAGTVMVDGAAGGAVAPAGTATLVGEGETVINGRRYFNVVSAQTGTNPYVSDGTDEGTVMLVDPTPNPPDPWENQMRPAARFLPVAGGKVVFPANTFTHTFVFNPNSPRGYTVTVRHDLFVTDGTPAGTALLETVPQLPPQSVQTKDSMYTNFVRSGGTLYFAAVGADQRDGLWRTDGTAAGTVRVSDAVGNLSRLTDLNGTLLFLGTGADGVQGLWRSDGTAAGTVRVAQMPAPATADYRFLTTYRAVAGGVLYFINGSDLWKTDGTSAGTVLLRTFDGPPLGSVGQRAGQLTAAGDTLYFYASSAASGWEPWTSDGTPAGTVMVKDVNPGPGDSYRSNESMAAVGGVAYFAAVDGAGQKQVWKTDGTEAGTVPVSPPRGEPQAYQDLLTAAGGLLYYREYDGNDWKLWRTDGTAAGTRVVHPELFLPDGMFVKGGKLLFSATTETDQTGRDYDLYSLNPATDTLTKLIGGVRLDSRDAPTELDGRWFFRNVVTDGRASGTRPLPAYPGEFNDVSNFWSLVATEERVLLGTKTALYGREPWVVYVGDGVLPRPDSRVVGRHVFYNHSEFDDDNARADEDDDGAIATDKRPLLPGAASATFENVTSYSRGINGVMIDVRDLSAAALARLSADDFVFRSGRSPAQLSTGVGPPTVSVRRGRGVGGSDRISLTWPDYNRAAPAAGQAVANGWLQVTMLANEDTWLDEADVFLFANLIGETGTTTSVAGTVNVNATDVAAVKRNLTTGAVPITSPYDFNKDGRVNALDIAAVKGNLTRNLVIAWEPTTAAAPPPPAAPGGADETATAWLRSES